MSWQPGRPRDVDQINAITDILTSNRSAQDAALRVHFLWSDNTAGAGSVRTSSLTGTACFYYGPRSTVSFPGQEGSGQVVSDESRVGIYLEQDLVPIGSSRAVHGLNEALANNPGSIIYGTHLNTMQVVQNGVVHTDSAGAGSVTFDQAYNGVPKLQVMSSASVPKSEGSYVVTAIATATGSAFSAVYVGPGADPDEARILWRSVGSVTL